MNDDMSAELKKEVAEAVKILRDDGHAASLSAIQAKLAKAFPDEPEPEPDPDPNAPPPPPKKEPAPPVADVTRKSRFSWWPDDKAPDDA